MSDVICEKCGYKTNTKEENVERGSTCPICNGELKVQGANTCGSILLIIIVAVIALVLWRFLS